MTFIRKRIVRAQGLALALAAVAVLSFGLHPAKAQSPKFYIGADFGSQNFSFATGLDRFFDKSFTGAGVRAGARLNDRISAELSYASYSGGNKSVTLSENETIKLGSETYMVRASSSIETRDMKLTSIGADFYGHFPLGTGAAELLAGGGFASTNIKGDIVVTPDGEDAAVTKMDDDEFRLRVSGGAQFNVSDRVGLRGLIRYYPTDAFDDSIKSSWEGVVGLHFSF